MKKYYPLLQNLVLFAGLMFGLALKMSHAASAEDCVTKEALFHIECPPDTTVYCGAEIWNLSIYGQAYVYGYGSPQPAGDPVVNYNLNSCGIGTITRTWYAYDYAGNQYSCTQVITVLGTSQFNGNDIHWPQDYHTYECGASLHPSDLPYPYNYPWWYQNQTGDCVNLMYSYDDLVFEINPPACIKILREWTVIDWCSYQPNNPYHHGGIWKHTQVIKVLAHNDPTINCPPDTVVPANGNCNGAYVNLPPATGMGDCGVDVEITNNSPYADTSGANASGFYPLGTTMVKFTARDLCGNKKTCKTLVTVKDMTKPTPICIHGISSTLALMQDGYYLDLQPKFFNKNSYDNCTPKNQLQFEIFPKRLTCDDLGENEVTLVVTDASGNSQFCTTYIDLQDNMGMCPPDTSTITLSGNVVNLSGEPMQGVELFDAATGNENLTDEQGAFTISIYQNNTVSLAPYEMNSGLEGVTVYDLLLMQMHILGEYDFQNPVAELSADINYNEEISVLDIATLQMQLLGYEQEMPMGYWGFVLVDDLSNDEIVEGFEHPQHYFTEHEVNDSLNKAYFVGFPFGDIDASAWEGWNQSVLEDRRGAAFPIKLNAHGSRLELICQNSIQTLGLQLQMRLPGTQWELGQITSDVLPLSNGMSMRTDGEETILTIALPLDRERTIQTNDVLLAIEHGGVLTAKEIERLDLQSELMPPEIYSAGLNIHPIEWRFDDTPDQSLTMKAFPNPFEKRLTIEYYVPLDAADMELTVTDMTGKVILTKALKSGRTGWNQASITAVNEWPVGMYFIRLSSETEQVQKRLIKTE